MSTYDATRIEKPRYFTLSPLKQGRGNREPHVIGFDTEAIKGQPVMLQISEGGGPEAADLFVLSDRPHAALDKLLYWVTDHCRDRGREHIIVGFNLMYEWTQLFGDLPPEITAAKEFILIWTTDDGQRWRLSAWNHQRHAMTMINEESHVRIRVIDAAAFFPGSLDAVAEMVGVERKDPIDKEYLSNLAHADLSDPVFRHYAAQDAVVTRLIGERIVAMHEEYDLPTCMTAPQFAARVFRRHYLGETVPLPLPALEQAGLLSYHGGKNGFYLHQPTEIKAWSLDIVSAYPEAMRALPALEGSQWRRSDAYQPGAHALWLARFRHHPCRFTGAQTHGGQRLPRGEVMLWLTGYELDVMIERDEAQHPAVLDGWIMEGSTNGGGLVSYVDKFFSQKQTAIGAERATAKLLLVSLYGKFFQKMPLGTVGTIQGIMDPTTGGLALWEDSSNPLQPYDYRAGGLYHPPVASLITGFVRARVHRLEHEYWAMATSTDGLFARRPPWSGDIGTGLGKLTAEYGTLRIWRERLYDFRLPPGGLRTKPMSKVALHGFRGSADDLRQIPLRPGAYQYTARHPVSLRESQRLLRDRRYRPGEFAELSFTLDLR